VPFDHLAGPDGADDIGGETEPGEEVGVLGVTHPQLADEEGGVHREHDLVGQLVKDDEGDDDPDPALAGVDDEGPDQGAEEIPRALDRLAGVRCGSGQEVVVDPGSPKQGHRASLLHASRCP